MPSHNSSTTSQPLPSQPQAMTSSRLAHSSLLHRHHGDTAAHPAQPQQQQQPQQEHQQQQQRRAVVQADADVHHHHRQQQQQLLQAFYSREGEHLDVAFYIIHLVMSAVHKRMLVTSREQLGFQLALAIFSGALLMRLFFKPLYARVRPQLVFAIHIGITFIRAGVVNTMAHKQAVHARSGVAQGTESYNTAVVLAMTQLAILGGPFRLFEMMGLQQPWRYHAIGALVYLASHPVAAATGIRLAFSNTMFFQVHAVHDGVSALVEALLSFVSGFPEQQQTCSSCAGVAIYGFMCLFGSVAVPLYFMYVREQAALKRWGQHTAAASAGAGVGAGGGGVGSASAAHHGRADASAASAPQFSLQHSGSGDMQCLGEHANGNSSGSSGSSGSGSGSSTPARRMTRLEAICLKAEAAAAERNAGSCQLPSFSDLVTSDILLVRWCVHLSTMLCLLVSCWLVSNSVALVLLPRVLSPFQLDRWCPNRPHTPYVIAGQIYYEGA